MYPVVYSSLFQGCHSLLEDYLKDASLINGVIGIVIAVIEVRHQKPTLHRGTSLNEDTLKEYIRTPYTGQTWC